MKKCVFLMAAAAMMAACSSDNSEEPVTNSDEIEVTFRLRGFEYTTEPMTRTATDVSEYVNHLDVWIINGTDTTAVHQTSMDAGFGGFTVTLNKTKTYQMYAVAHKADGATLSNNIISFVNDKVTHSMVYQSQFTPTATTMVCEMQRIVAQFRLETTDAVPDDVTKMRITINDVFDRWNVISGGTHSLNRVSTVNVGSKNQDGSAAFSVYAIVTDAETQHDILVEALDAQDAVVRQQTFAGVTLRNDYRTIARGAFFTDTASPFSFVANDWQVFDTIQF